MNEQLIRNIFKQYVNNDLMTGATMIIYAIGELSLKTGIDRTQSAYEISKYVKKCIKSDISQAYIDSIP